MPIAEPSLVVTLVGIMLLAGLVNGVAGFGFAVVGTTVLASVIDPATAVVVLIVPILAANLLLARDLSVSELRTCGTRFGPLVAAALVGTIVGMAVLDRIPDAPLRVGLGVVTLAFVGSLQQRVSLPGLSQAKEGCFVETPRAMAGFGGVSGLLFGATNVGVQLVAYIRSCDLPHGLFVGVVALVFVGINAVRVGAAGLLGLYPSSAMFALSIGAAIPGLLGVAIGTRVRDRIAERTRRIAVLMLLTVIGVRLVLGGLGIV